MIFQASTDNLPFVVQVLRSNEADHAVYQKGGEGARHSVGASFQGKLIQPVVSICRQGATLTCLKVHNVVAYPSNVTIAVVLENTLPPFTQNVEIDTEADISGFSTGNGLEE